MNFFGIMIGTLALLAGTLLIWLPVRIFNRSWRDRKARLGIVLLLALLSYPALLGPCCWISSRAGGGSQLVTAIYRPLKQQTIAIFDQHGFVGYADGPLNRAFDWYSELGAPDGWHWTVIWLDIFEKSPRWAWQSED